MEENSDTTEGEPGEDSVDHTEDEGRFDFLSRWMLGSLRHSEKDQSQPGEAKRVGYSVEPVGSVGESSVPVPPRDALYRALQGMSAYYETAMIGLSQVDVPPDSDEVPS
ncbi:hypothetical protein OG194_32495 [Streptomyces sp. NBC_01288]|uniref:hypothetical protein n=1 Tax=Streptomyces sp. NBC_01288 TaxID=2903814 RepID=UPI002E126B88|nr:hypothetical protein OG194_32495 [Streptomyces sp. NBC_01288]